MFEVIRDVGGITTSERAHAPSAREHVDICPFMSDCRAYDAS